MKKVQNDIYVITISMVWPKIEKEVPYSVSNEISDIFSFLDARGSVTICRNILIERVR